jgi:ABC-type phosphate transport system auxiliary subunit|tara:strand:+ start:693 stop:917 length:225 start_codon:yes stop_codon:yes gene_type:complete
MLKEKTAAELDLEIKVALLGQRQDQLEASLSILDRRLSRMEESLSNLRTEMARWGGAIGFVAAAAPFVSGLLHG